MARENDVLIIGPSKAGKTCMLGAMVLSANLSQQRGSETFPCTITPVSDNMIRLVQEATDVLLAGRLDAVNPDHEVKEYLFDFEVDITPTFWEKLRTSLFSSGIKKLRFCVMDGPGGDLFAVRSTAAAAAPPAQPPPPRPGGTRPDSQQAKAQPSSGPQRFRDKLIDRARRAEGLILCVDATNEAMAATFARELSALVAQVREDGRRWRLRRLVILLTKTDMYFHRLGREAEASARAADPWERAVFLLTEQGLGALRGAAATTEIACGWASSYGFIPGHGSANYNDATKTLRTLDPRPERAAVSTGLWQPFRLLDPLIYLATGRLGSLAPLHR